MGAALNDTRVWKISQVWSKIKRGVQIIRSKCPIERGIQVAREEVREVSGWLLRAEYIDDLGKTILGNYP